MNKKNKKNILLSCVRFLGVKLGVRKWHYCRIHRALQLEVCDQCNQKPLKGRLKVPKIDFLYLFLP